MTPAEKLAHYLYELSMNMWWAWNPSVIKLFRDIDPEGFRASKHNPLMVVRRLSRERLHEMASDPAYRLLYVGNIVRMQEEIGTGGGGFRFIYASFLQEAARQWAEPRLQEASELMTRAGDGWREFALLGARFCKRRSEVTLDQLADAMLVCAAHEHDAFCLLRAIRL